MSIALLLVTPLQVILAAKTLGLNPMNSLRHMFFASVFVALYRNLEKGPSGLTKEIFLFMGWFLILEQILRFNLDRNDPHGDEALFYLATLYLLRRLVSNQSNKPPKTLLAVLTLVYIYVAYWLARTAISKSLPGGLSSGSEWVLYPIVNALLRIATDQ